jgi:hypothetical protein
MSSSGIVTIFGEPQGASVQPSPFFVSVVLHALAFGLVTIKMIDDRRIIERFPPDRYALQVLDFHSAERQTRPAVDAGISYPGPYTGGTHGQSPPAGKPAGGGRDAGASQLTRQTVQLMPAPQTLIEPDLPHELLVHTKAPVPLVVLWTPGKLQPRKIVPPQPDKAAIAAVRPSLDMPAKDEKLADIRISSTPSVTLLPAAPPGTTSPVVVHGPEQAMQVPQTTSRLTEPPTPARVISLSDIRVAEGKVFVPVANETSPKQAPGTTIPGQLRPAAVPAAGGEAASKSHDAGAGKGAGDRVGELAGNDGKPGLAPNSTVRQGKPGPSTSEAAQTGAPAGVGQSFAQGSATGGPANGISSVRISLPKDGQFGVVVFGSSIQEDYPETAELWSGRLASTVYLHVGLAKSWILQYALPRIVDAASAGNGGRLEAPWPYEILRPNVDPGDLNADALIVHGYVDKDGRFEKLEVVFPAQLAQAPTVVNVLSQWQFRPAKLNGLFAAVEVLLIIPDQSD